MRDFSDKNAAFWALCGVVVVAILVGGGYVVSKIRGIFNNNPGNLRYTGTAWKGLTGKDSKGFCVFDTPTNGIRAMTLNAMTVGANLLKAGKDANLEEFGEVWAPVSDNPGSRFGEYGRALAASMGLDSTKELDFTSPAILSALIPAIVRNENGLGPFYTPQVYAEAITNARNYRGLA